jgi:alpha-L-fucosidase 2
MSISSTEKLDGLHSAWNESAATDWRDATPFGNGTLGALHFGGLAHDRLLLNHERLFAGAVTPPMPDISDALPELRGLLAAGDWETANDFYAARWKGSGYAAEPARYLPGPVLNWDQGSQGLFRNYRRWVDFSTGVGGIEWWVNGERFRREVFASFANEAILFRPFASGTPACSAEIWFSPQHFSESTDDDGAQVPVDIDIKNTSGDGWIACSLAGPDNAAYAGVVSWSSASTVFSTRRGVVIEPSTETLLCMSVLLDPTPEKIEREARRLAAIALREDLKRRHIAIHAELYNRCRVDLETRDAHLSNDELLLRAGRGDASTALIARLANFGRYLLIASSASGSLPPNLQGIWNGNFRPPWWGGFFFNENIQMALMPALPGDLPECVTKLFDLLESKMEDFRTNAQKMFGCRGILPPLFMAPDSGLKKNHQAHVMYWTGSGAWLAQLYYDYWLHTGDHEFLCGRAMPFLREAALFYEDFLIGGEDGKLHSSPSNSPENVPLGHLSKDGVGMRVCVDATMDFALIRELLRNLLSAASVTECTDSETAHWSDMLDRLPDYRINRDGALAEWVDPRLQDNYCHRHLSHLYPLFPGREVAPSDERMIDACRVAVEKRQVVGLGSQTGWSLAHMAHIYCRLGDASRALESLEVLCRFVVGQNLFTVHNDLRDMGVTMSVRKGLKSAVQTEANNGITSAVYEMLAFSDTGVLRLFPALPSSWKRGSLRGLRLRGGGALDLRWDFEKGSWRAELTGPSREISLPDGFSIQTTDYASTVDAEGGLLRISGEIQVAEVEPDVELQNI